MASAKPSSGGRAARLRGGLNIEEKGRVKEIVARNKARGVSIEAIRERRNQARHSLRDAQRIVTEYRREVRLGRRGAAQALENALGDMPYFKGEMRIAQAVLRASGGK